MSNAATAPSGRGEVAYPPTVSVREAWPWLLFGLAFLALFYLVGMDEGALSIVPGHTVHEWVHDGRHLLGFPCH
jgi:ABC-type spermidine/putrescine transport system permease subunit II